MPSYVGVSYYIHCIATAGDSPIVLTWLRNGWPIHPGKVTRRLVRHWIDPLEESHQMRSKRFIHQQIEDVIASLGEPYSKKKDFHIQTSDGISRVSNQEANPIGKAKEFFPLPNTGQLFNPVDSDRAWQASDYPVLEGPLPSLSSDQISGSKDDPLITINRLGDRSSALKFSQLVTSHSGNYTCLARNSAGITSMSKMLYVEGGCYNI